VLYEGGSDFSEGVLSTTLRQEMVKAFIDAQMLRAHEMNLQYEWWIPKG
jgi:hypothetical protein